MPLSQRLIRVKCFLSRAVVAIFLLVLCECSPPSPGSESPLFATSPSSINESFSARPSSARLATSVQGSFTAHFEKKLATSSQDFATVSSKKRPLPYEPVPMRGFYIGLPGKAVRWLETCKELCANAVVLDLKNDDGEITCKGLDLPSDFPYKELIGCRNIKEILSILKKKRIYTIARIVVFKDKYMATLMPNLAVLTKEKNVFVDKEKSVWLNPYNKDVWVYIANIAKGAAKVGFDEVQLDYVRFSAYRDKKADYGPTSGNTSRIAIINQFIDFIKSELAAFDVKLSIDVFGCIIPDVLPLVEESSARLGQDFQSIAERVDFICPMIYPSHFPSGSLRIKHPDLHPYKIIYTSTLRTIEAIKKNPKIKAKVRPWLQAFSAFWLRKGAYQHYGKTQALAQERATIAAGADQLCFWNSGAKYASILED